MYSKILKFFPGLDFWLLIKILYLFYYWKIIILYFKNFLNYLQKRSSFLWPITTYWKIPFWIGNKVTLKSRYGIIWELTNILQTRNNGFVGALTPLSVEERNLWWQTSKWHRLVDLIKNFTFVSRSQEEFVQNASNFLQWHYSSITSDLTRIKHLYTTKFIFVVDKYVTTGSYNYFRKKQRATKQA